MKAFSLVTKYPNGRYAAVILVMTATRQVAVATTAIRVRNRNEAARQGQALKRDIDLSVYA